jgi:hypothetical protein
VVSIAGPEAFPEDSEACASRHCALHNASVIIEELALARPIRPAHAVVAAPPPMPIDGSFWRRLRQGGDTESHGPAAS